MSENADRAEPAPCRRFRTAQHRGELARVPRKQPGTAQWQQRQGVRQAHLAGLVEHQQVEGRFTTGGVTPAPQLAQAPEGAHRPCGRHGRQPAAAQHLLGTSAQLLAQLGHPVRPGLQGLRIPRGRPRRLRARQALDQPALPLRIGRDEVFSPHIGRRMEARAQTLDASTQNLPAALVQRLVHRQCGQVHRGVGGRQQQHPGLRAQLQVLRQHHPQRGRLAGARRPPEEGAALLQQAQRLALARPQPSEGGAGEHRSVGSVCLGSPRPHVTPGGLTLQPAQRLQRLCSPAGIPPGLGHRTQEACWVQANQLVGTGRRAAGVVKQQLVVLHRQRQHPGAATLRCPPPGGGAVQAVVQQGLCRVQSTATAFGEDVPGLQGDAPERAFGLAAQHLEVIELGGGLQLGLQGGADLVEGHGGR